jgi:hypothetical protein
MEHLLEKQVGGDDWAEIAVAPGVADGAAEAVDEFRGDRIGNAALDCC